MKESGEITFFWLQKIGVELHNWLVVSTHLKNISQNGNLSQIGMTIKISLSCHHLDNKSYHVKLNVQLHLPEGSTLAKVFFPEVKRTTMARSVCFHVPIRYMFNTPT